MEAECWRGKTGEQCTDGSKGGGVECRQFFSKFDGTRSKGHCRRFCHWRVLPRKRAHRTRAVEQSVSVSEQNPLGKCPVTNALSIFLPELKPIHAGAEEGKGHRVQGDHSPLQGSLLRGHSAGLRIRK